MKINQSGVFSAENFIISRDHDQVTTFLQRTTISSNASQGEKHLYHKVDSIIVLVTITTHHPVYNSPNKTPLPDYINKRSTIGINDPQKREKENLLAKYETKFDNNFEEKTLHDVRIYEVPEKRPLSNVHCPAFTKEEITKLRARLNDKLHTPPPKLQR